MRCPKCGYISFDHNDSCPKCNRNLSSERERLNLISFPPDPPFVLAGLLGDINESGMHYHPAGSGTFKALDEEIEFEAETEQMAVSPSSEDEQTEIEIELDSLGEEETSAPELEYLDTAEAETLTPGPEAEGLEVDSTELSTLDTQAGLELETSGLEVEGSGEQEVKEEPEPLVFEIEDINLEESPTGDELELELSRDELSEAPTEVYGTTEHELELTLDEEPSVVEEIEEVADLVDDDQATSVSAELTAHEDGVVPRPESEHNLSLQDLKDDELGEVDVTIDELEKPTQKIADGHGG